jgi:drug/metabolite transporter (DMT)-like permease
MEQVALSHARKMPFNVLAGLILCNLIWSAHPAMAKLVLADFPPALTAWLRYSSALLAYLVTIPLIRKRGLGPAFFKPSTVRDGLLVAAVGIMAFCFAPLLQMTGLQSSRATDNALIVAMEPLMTVVLARIFVGERLSKTHYVAFSLALSGFALLSGIHGVGESLHSTLSATLSATLSGSSSNLIGNLLMLTALVGEASYSILGLKLVHRFDPLGIFGSALAIGVGILTLSTMAIEGPHVFLALSHLGWKSALGLLWLGPLGTAFAYFYWMSVLREASVATIALTLFIQPVLGAVWGYVFLGETLSGVQALGGLLIILGVMTQSLVSRYRATVPA